MNENAMNEKQYGEIPLTDYLEIVGHERRAPMKRLMLGVGALVLCLLCAAAGDYYDPWYGDLRDITPEQAMAILEHPDAVEWVSETGMHAAFRHSRELLDRLQEVAKRSARDADYASVYLLNLSLRGVRHIAELADLGILPGRQEASLELLRSECDR